MFELKRDNAVGSSELLSSRSEVKITFDSAIDPFCARAREDSALHNRRQTRIPARIHAQQLNMNERATCMHSHALACTSDATPHASHFFSLTFMATLLKLKPQADSHLNGLGHLAQVACARPWPAAQVSVALPGSGVSGPLRERLAGGSRSLELPSRRPQAPAFSPDLSAPL